ncbi:MAG TPA: nitroreductase/quinone reductase family protein [Ktedonobacteraceae bacterium]|nr:nitroreductase/quinone reductase family protein [Ktedonobacteraceae bacterium]
MSDWNERIIREFRANGGELRGEGDTFLLLLTTTGRKSGQTRTTPLAYKLDGDRYIVVASFRGAPKHPDWYLNLVAHPQVTLEVGKETFNAIATTVESSERERLLEQWPVVKEHQTLTTREIPFVALQRVN